MEIKNLPPELLALLGGGPKKKNPNKPEKEWKGTIVKSVLEPGYKSEEKPVSETAEPKDPAEVLEYKIDRTYVQYKAHDAAEAYPLRIRLSGVLIAPGRNSFAKLQRIMDAFKEEHGLLAVTSDEQAKEQKETTGAGGVITPDSSLTVDEDEGGAIDGVATVEITSAAKVDNGPLAVAGEAVGDMIAEAVAAKEAGDKN